jgi:hypothetical protein
MVEAGVCKVTMKTPDLICMSGFYHSFNQTDRAGFAVQVGPE